MRKTTAGKKRMTDKRGMEQNIGERAVQNKAQGSMRTARGTMWALVLCVMFCILSLGGMVQAEETERKIEYSFNSEFVPVSGAALPEAKIMPTPYSAQSSGWGYGRQLSGEAKRIYDKLAGVNLRNYNSTTRLEMKLPSSVYFANMIEYYAQMPAYMTEWVRGAHAYMEDFGEEYWATYIEFDILAYQNVISGAVRMDGISMYPVDYYKGIRDEFGITETELQKAAAAVQKGTSRADKVRIAHDYIIDMMEYDKRETGAAATVQPQNHTITGGLLEKYGHLGVCECYAKLFRLLCNRNGIPCILISGGSKKDAAGNVVADHMWNYVQMDDGLWYLVDVTWDDEATAIYDYFLAGSQTVADGVAMAQSHMPVGCFSPKNGTQYEAFRVPALARKGYALKNTDMKPVTGISLNTTSVAVDVGKTTNVSVKGVTPAGANYGNRYTFVSSDTSVASVDQSGRVTARKAGTVTITVSSTDLQTVTAACTVTVRNHDGGWKTVTEATYFAAGKKDYVCSRCGVVESQVIPQKTPFVTLNASSFPLQLKKKTAVLKVKTKCDPSDTVVGWTSSKPKIATVNSKGKITAKKAGTTYITVKMKSGATAKCKVKVQKGTVKLKGVKVAKKSVTLKVGESFSLGAAKNPLTAPGKLTYRSASKKIAAVNKKGVVTAKKKGKTTITVKAGSKSVKVKITVK